jgi:hypothetical protein
LGAVYGVLWRYQHGDGIVDGEDHEREENRGDEQRLRRRAALLDLIDTNPKKPKALQQCQLFLAKSGPLTWSWKHHRCLRGHREP